MTHAEGNDEWADAVPPSDPEPPRTRSSRQRAVLWPDSSDVHVRASYPPARGLAAELIGLTENAARKRIGGRHPNFLFRVVDYRDPVTADFCAGRITLCIRNGHVVNAFAG